MWSSNISVPLEKYFDTYDDADMQTACIGGTCYGHALSETVGWYDDLALFATTGWLLRGGPWNGEVNAGIFEFEYFDGSGTESRTFQVVLLGK